MIKVAPFQEDFLVQQSLSSHRVSIHAPKELLLQQLQPVLLFIYSLICRWFCVLEALRPAAAWEALTVREE